MIPTEEQTGVVESISRLIQATKSKQVQWTRANPSTFVWIHSSARVTLQRAEQQKQVVNPATRQISVIKATSHIFQLNSPSNVQLLAINSTDDKFAGEILAELYQAAENSVAVQGLEILKKLIP